MDSMGPSPLFQIGSPVYKDLNTDLSACTAEAMCNLEDRKQLDLSCIRFSYGLTPHLRDTMVPMGSVEGFPSTWAPSPHVVSRMGKGLELDESGITPIPVTYRSNGKGVESYLGAPVLLQDSTSGGDLLASQEPWNLDLLHDTAQSFDYNIPIQRQHHQSSPVSRTSWSGDTASNLDATPEWYQYQIAGTDVCQNCQPMILDESDTIQSENNPNVLGKKRHEGDVLEGANAGFMLSEGPDYDPLDTLLQDLKEEAPNDFDGWPFPVGPEQPPKDFGNNNPSNPPKPSAAGLPPAIKQEDPRQNLPTGFQEVVEKKEQEPAPTDSNKSKEAAETAVAVPQSSPMCSTKTSAPTTPQRSYSETLSRPRMKTSEHTGVSKHRKSGRWEVHIWLSSLGRQVYLGGYDDVDSAAEAYDIVQIRSRGKDAKTNFPKSRYKEQMERVSQMSLPELISHVRRGSKGFSRGVSEYRGVTLNPNGRWEARIGAYGSRHVYLGLYGDQKEAAIHYDCALVRLRGSKAATNFPLGDYKSALAEHDKLLVALGDVCIGSLGRIPSIKPQFELFLKYGGWETDLLISAVRRMDARERPTLKSRGVKTKSAARKKVMGVAHKQVFKVKRTGTPGSAESHGGD